MKTIVVNKRENEKVMREVKKELREFLYWVNKGFILLNKYCSSCLGIPCYIKKVYGFDIFKGDVKTKEINTEKFTTKI